MRIYCLSSDPNYPCLVLAAKGCTIMLDCGLNMKCLKYFLPQMLVPNLRFENLPNCRTQNGTQIENVKEFNNRIFINSTLEFGVPQFNLINIEDIDAVLISNYNSMLALPYLTKIKGFRAAIYCTEPVMQFGKILMEELTHYVKNNQTIMLNNQTIEEQNKIKNDQAKYPLFRTLEHLSIKINENENQSSLDDNKKVVLSEATLSNSIRLAKPDNFSHNDECLPPPSKQLKTVSNENENENDIDLTENSKNDFKLKNYMQLASIFNITEPNMKPINWRYLYNKEDIELCMSKIKIVGFNERISVFGSLVVQPKSSGHSLGSCNWTIESDCDVISYLSRSSLLSTHSKLFNPLFYKQQIIDCMLVTGLNQAVLYDPEQMIQDFCKACIVTVKNQGNVLIPVYPTGKIYDLIECLYRYLTDAQLQNIPVYFMSTVANQSLAYSNIYAEWLNDTKQNLVNAAESPFQHGELVKNGLLKVFPSINSKFNDEFNQPCILFASHPSLRFGEACHFVELWKNSPANAFIFTDPEFNYLDALAPFQPVYANFYYFPIDTSLNTNQIHKIFKETKQISQLITSAQYKITNNEQNTMPQDHFSKIDQTRIGPNTIVNYYVPNDIIKLNLKRRFENCEIEAELASMIIPTKKTISLSKDLSDLNINGNIAFTTFNSQLVTKNNSHILKAAPRTIPLMLTKRARINESNLKKYTYGKLNLELFLKVLRQSGFASLKLIEKENSDSENLTVSAIDKDTLLIDSNSESKNYLIKIDNNNRINVDLNLNKVNVYCDNEDIRNKIKDSLLKCLKTL